MANVLASLLGQPSSQLPTIPNAGAVTPPISSDVPAPNQNALVAATQTNANRPQNWRQAVAFALNPDIYNAEMDRRAQQARQTYADQRQVTLDQRNDAAYAVSQQDAARKHQLQDLQDSYSILKGVNTQDDLDALKANPIARRIIPDIDRADMQTVKQIQQAGAQFFANPKEQYTLAPGSARYDERGRKIAEQPFAPSYHTVGEGQTLVQTGGQPPADPNAPRSVRNNNAGNIEDGPFAKGQPGYVGGDGRFAQFDTPQNGRNAQLALLDSYGQRGFNTVNKIIGRWAPASDGNDVSGYAGAVARSLGVSPDQPLDLANPTVKAGLADAMAKVEGGASASGVSTTPGTRVIAQGAPKEKDEITPLDDKAIDYVATQYILTGQLPALGNGKDAAAQRLKIINRAAAIEQETGATGQDAVARHATVKAATSALSKISSLRSQIQASEQTVKDNADYVLTLAPKGGGPTGSPILNMPIQQARERLWGSKEVSAFNNAIGTVADEYAKVMTSSTGTGGVSSDSARQEAYKRLSNSATFGQLQSNIEAMKVEMANRLKSLEGQESDLRDSIQSGGKPKPRLMGSGTVSDPFDLSGGQSRNSVPMNAFYRDPQGNIRKNINGDRGNPIVRPAGTGQGQSGSSRKPLSAIFGN